MGKSEGAKVNNSAENNESEDLREESAAAAPLPPEDNGVPLKRNIFNMEERPIVSEVECDTSACFLKKWIRLFIQKCLDTSITGKLLGMLVVCLLGFGVMSVHNIITLGKIENRIAEVETQTTPQYKVSQYVLRRLNGFKISLINIINMVDEDSEVVLNQRIMENRQRLEDLKRMLSAIKDGGKVQDVAKISQEVLDTFSASPADKQTARYQVLVNIIENLGVVEDSFKKFSVQVLMKKNNGDGDGDENNYDASLSELLDDMDDLYEKVTEFTILINKQHNLTINESVLIIDSSRKQTLFIAIFTGIVLTIGTILYIIIIVFPLKDILQKVKDISKGASDGYMQRIEVHTHDEVGQLARQLNLLIDNIFSINAFKAVIEEEETTTDVHQRLATLLEERYGFDKLYIYEIQNQKKTMSVAHASKPQFMCDPDILDDSSLCRAKRTGHPISSIEYPDICMKFPYRQTMEHYCIPMIAAGQVIGIVQILFDKKGASEDSLNNFESLVLRAKRFVKEATPVVEAKRFASALQETTFKDPLTNLYNRRFLESYSETLVASTLRRNSRLGILMCDMDFFKNVNDSYGHEAGDMVLVKTADILINSVRSSDMIIRYGGEEFIVLLIDVESREKVMELGERIRKNMEDTSIKIADGTLKKTISIGCSIFPEDTEAFWESIKFADVALYRAKEEGRNRVISFDRAMWSEENY